MLVDKQLPALYNGVSQQPATLRLPSQAEVQVNGYGTVVDGLRKRPPTEHVARLSPNDLSAAHLHTINRDTVERYEVVLIDNDLKVFDLAGNEKTVAFPGRAAWVASTAYSALGVTVRPVTPNGFLYRVTVVGTSGSSEPTWPVTLGNTVVNGTVTFECTVDYLNVTDAKTDFAAVTVADYTFIVNKTVTAKLDAVATDLTADPTTYWWLNRDFMGSDILNQLQLARQLQYPTNPTGVTFQGTKQSFQDLPATANNGDLWKIQGTSDTEFATYYVVRVGAVWNETVNPGLKNKFDATTMPHALVRKADGTFEFGPFSWNPRRVGDETTNPNPTFVGRQIKDVYFYKNRLGFVVDENIVMSRVGDFGTFHRLTVIDKLADDVLDTGATDTQVTKFNHAVPFDKTMMIFSGQVQFQLLNDGPLAGGRETLRPATRYEMVKIARPLALGSDVYFGSEDGNWAKMYEYYVRDNSASSEAGEITAHVPRYIPAGITKIAGSSDHDVVFVLTSGASNRVYVYKFYWANEEEKAQSSWSYWEFNAGDNVLSVEVIDNYVYFVIERDGGTFLERAALDSGALAPGLPFQIFLDRRATVTGTYLTTPPKTEFNLPYTVPTADRANFRIVRGAGFSTAAGAVVSLTPADYEWIDGDTVRVPGDVDAASCQVGMNYEFRYTFSKQFMRNPQEVPIVTGRLVMRTFTVYFINTAYFKTEVAPYGVNPNVEEVVPSHFTEFDGKTIGVADLLIGTPVFADGAYTFTVGGEGSVATITLVNDTPYGSTFQQAEWEGSYWKRYRTL